MKRKIVTLLGVAALSCAIMTGCGSKDAQTEAPAQETEETAEADTTKAELQRRLRKLTQKKQKRQLRKQKRLQHR